MRYHLTEQLDKFAKALDKLIEQGALLEMAMEYACNRKEFEAELKRRLKDDKKIEAFLKNIPNFSNDYQTWYSISHSLIGQIIPNRLTDFQNYYEFPRARKEITFHNYMIKDMLQGLRITRSYDHSVIADGSAAIPEFQQQLSILKAAREKLDSVLANITSIIQAELFDSEIDGAEALAKAGFYRAAGTICGVVIEKHLTSVINLHKIPIKKKNPTISDLSELLKAQDIISVAQWRYIQHLADIRNLCGHAKGKEPTKDEVEDLVSGTKKILKTVY